MEKGYPNEAHDPIQTPNPTAKFQRVPVTWHLLRVTFQLAP